MSVNFLFYSTQGLVDDAVVFFVVVADFANERNQYKETTTDKSHHDLSIHRITLGVLVVLVGLRHVPIKQADRQLMTIRSQILRQ